MTKTKHFILYRSIIIALLIGLYSLFKSNVDSISYIKSLDLVLSIIIHEGWKFISSPSIFLTLVAAFFLWEFRDNILSMFPAIKEIKAGPFSASLNYAVQNSLIEIPNIEAQNTANQTNEAQEVSVKQNEEIINYIINRSGLRSCQLYLAVDKSSLTVNDWIRKMSEFEIYDSIIKTDDEKLRYQFYHGLFRGTEKYAIGKLFSNKRIDPESKALYFELLPTVREKIQFRYNELIAVIRKNDEVDSDKLVISQ